MSTHAGRGFTLVELLVVVAILALIATMSVTNYVRMTDRAHVAACHANQRTIFRDANLFAIDQGVQRATWNVVDLVAAGAVPTGAADCPLSDTEDFSDYVITVAGGAVAVIRCEVAPESHHLDFPFAGSSSSGPPSGP